MRKVKLQMQITVDGYVAGPNGELDWMTWNWDDKLKEYGNELTDSIDTILLGRKMTEDFISHWSNVVTKPGDPEYSFAKKMMDIPKIVFLKLLKNLFGKIRPLPVTRRMKFKSSKSRKERI